MSFPSKLFDTHRFNKPTVWVVIRSLDSEADAIQSVAKILNDRFAASDVDSIITCYADDAAMLPPGENIVVGKDGNVFRGR